MKALWWAWLFINIAPVIIAKFAIFYKLKLILTAPVPHEFSVFPDEVNERWSVSFIYLIYRVIFS